MKTGGILVGAGAAVAGLTGVLGGDMVLYGAVGSVGLAAAGGVSLAIGLPMWATGRHRHNVNEQFLAGISPSVGDRRRKGRNMTLGAVGLAAGGLLVASADHWVMDTVAVGMVVSSIPLGVMGVGAWTSKGDYLRFTPMAGGAPGATMSMSW